MMATHTMLEIAESSCKNYQGHLQGRQSKLAKEINSTSDEAKKAATEKLQKVEHQLRQSEDRKCFMDSVIHAHSCDFDIDLAVLCPVQLATLQLFH